MYLRSRSSLRCKTFYTRPARAISCSLTYRPFSSAHAVSSHLYLRTSRANSKCNVTQVPAQYQSDPNIIRTYFDWNENLHKGAAEFITKHPDITLLMYSSWDVFDKVYQDPVKFGFRARDLKMARGGIWADFIHPTSKMHAVLAKDMEEFLDQFPTRVQPQSSLTEGEPVVD